MSEWERVQRLERAYHEAKDPDRVLPVNLRYWRRILQCLPGGPPALGPATRVLDAGCGGAGILLALDGGDRTGFDPLMPFYLDRFPFLRQAGIDWRQATAEGFDAERPFDLIFSINMLDHVAEPRRAAANLERLLAPGGRLVLVLNVHLSRFWRRYFSLFYRWADPPHPHHIHRDDVAGYFPRLELHSSQDIDHLWLDLQGFYEEQVLHKKARDRGKLAAKLLNPFLYPLLAARLLGRPYHRRGVDDRPLQASLLYLFTRPL